MIVLCEWRDLLSHAELLDSEIAVWRIPLDDDGYVESHSVLSSAELERARRYRFAADRRRFSVCRAALRRIVASYLDVAAGSLIFATGPGGKPRLDPARHGAGLRFTVSHSGARALIALSLDRELGVDIEYVRPMPTADAVIAHCFSPRERAALTALPAERRHRTFFRAWALKEAYLKACGDGLTRPPDQIEVMAGADDAPPVLRVLDRPGDERFWTLCVIDAGDAYAAALAVERRDERPAP
jgi:4'-phosphopantetheinyl transferase